MEKRARWRISAVRRRICPIHRFAGKGFDLEPNSNLVARPELTHGTGISPNHRRNIESRATAAKAIPQKSRRSPERRFHVG
jgi:hypothetical protein